MTEEEHKTVGSVKQYITVALEMMKDELNGSYPEIIIVDQDDLDTLVEVLGGPDNIPGCKIYTDDAYTRGNYEYNYIAFPDDFPPIDEYGVVTQIHQPAMRADSFIDITDTYHEYIRYRTEPRAETSSKHFHVELDGSSQS
jgi:hypothetical protein